VNTFFNQWPYKTDMVVWGVENYWATPREFMNNSGDCEDYAIAKYFGLRDLGVPPELMRIAAVKNTIINIGHAVLVVFTDNDAVVLDNMTPLILSHSRLTHYKPEFSVNEQYRWRHLQPQYAPPR
jgi:predicted transglutaminase-like cysteine proteinase